MGKRRFGKSGRLFVVTLVLFIFGIPGYMEDASSWMQWSGMLAPYSNYFVGGAITIVLYCLIFGWWDNREAVWKWIKEFSVLLRENFKLINKQALADFVFVLVPVVLFIGLMVFLRWLFT